MGLEHLVLREIKDKLKHTYIHKILLEICGAMKKGYKNQLKEVLMAKAGNI